MPYSEISNLPQDLLKDRVILITGAYGGLGKHLSHACAQLGATVVILGRSLPHLESLYDELEAAGAPQPGIIPLDLQGATAKDYDDIANTLKNEFGQLNGIIHCAAILGALTPLQAYPAEEWSKTFATNLHGPMLLNRACLPLMQGSENASILFTLDEKNSAYWGAYGVSKAALKSYVSILADETEGQKDANGNPLVAINAIDPGPMRTRLRRKAFPGELLEESPVASEKILPFIELIARIDPSITASTVDMTNS